jgi:hypothetical protein
MREDTARASLVETSTSHAPRQIHSSIRTGFIRTQRSFRTKRSICGVIQSKALCEEETPMRIAAIALATALLFALPASAGTIGWGCSHPGPDSDSDGCMDGADNCDTIPNPTQTDHDSDGFGDICDCDYDGNNACDGADFLILGANFGTTVPPCPANVDQDDNLACDGADFLLFGAGFGQPPGPACGNPKGTSCYYWGP